MIRERKSSRELVMPHDAFKRLGFHKACRLAGVRLPRRSRRKSQ